MTYKRGRKILVGPGITAYQFVVQPELASTGVIFGRSLVGEDSLFSKKKKGKSRTIREILSNIFDEPSAEL